MLLRRIKVADIARHARRGAQADRRDLKDARASGELEAKEVYRERAARKRSPPIPPESIHSWNIDTGVSGPILAMQTLPELKLRPLFEAYNFET